MIIFLDIINYYQNFCLFYISIYIFKRVLFKEHSIYYVLYEIIFKETHLDINKIGIFYFNHFNRYLPNYCYRLLNQ